MYFVYVIYNVENNKIYIGSTSNIERRLIGHNAKAGNHYTSRFQGEWKLIYSEKLHSKTNALKREKQMKSYKGREFIKTFIPRKSTSRQIERWLTLRLKTLTICNPL